MNEFMLNFGGLWKAAVDYLISTGFKPSQIQPFILRAYVALTTTNSTPDIQLTKLDSSSALLGSNLLNKTDALYCIGARQAVVKVPTGEQASQNLHLTYPDDLTHDFTGEFKAVQALLQSALLTLTPNSDKPIFRDLLTEFFFDIPATQYLTTQYPQPTGNAEMWGKFKPFLQSFTISGSATNVLTLKYPITTGIAGDTSAEINYYCFDIAGVLLKDQAQAVVDKGMAQGVC